MPFPGVPQQKYVIFWSGEICVEMRSGRIMRGGVPYIRIALIPTEQAMWFRRIRLEDLDMSDNEYGYVVKEYPEKYFVDLSTSMENPVTLVLCNFDGSMSIDTDIQAARDETKRTQSRMATLVIENDNLIEKTKELVGKLRELGVDVGEEET